MGLTDRAVAVVVDPIQSVKGKVVIDAFRLINANQLVLGQEPRQTTSLLGHLVKPNIRALVHGLNRQYYSIAINYRKTELEQDMLRNLHKKSREDGADMLRLAKDYGKSLQEEEKMTERQLELKNIGKMDPKRHLEETGDRVMSNNVVQCLGSMLSTKVLK